MGIVFRGSFFILIFSMIATSAVTPIRANAESGVATVAATRDSEAEPVLEDYHACLKQGEPVHWVRRQANNRKESDYVAVDSAGKLMLRAKIQFRFNWFLYGEEFAEAKARMEAAKELMIAYLADYQIVADFDFSYNADFPPAAPGEDTFVVYLERYAEHGMRMDTWGLNLEWDDLRRSRIYLHEFLHQLGLLDEYPGANFLGQIGELDSLMRDVKHPQAKLYPRHLLEIASPLCP